MEVENFVKQFLDKHACNKYAEDDTLESIIKKWHEPYGVEFSQNTNFPKIELIRRYKTIFEQYNVFVDKDNVDIFNENAILFNCKGRLKYRLPEQRYSVLLYGSNEVKITSSDYAFVVVREVIKPNVVYLKNKNNSIITKI